MKGMISDEDYQQVYEEVLMSVIEGLIKLGKKAKIADTPYLIKKWTHYYWEQK